MTTNRGSASVREMTVSLQASERGTIGISLQGGNTDTVFQRVQIGDVADDGPAYHAGLRTNDRITAINGVPITADISHHDAVAMIDEGISGGIIHLSIQRIRETVTWMDLCIDGDTPDSIYYRACCEWSADTHTSLEHDSDVRAENCLHVLRGDIFRITTDTARSTEAANGGSTLGDDPVRWWLAERVQARDTATSAHAAKAADKNNEVQGYIPSAEALEQCLRDVQSTANMALAMKLSTTADVSEDTALRQAESLTTAFPPSMRPLTYQKLYRLDREKYKQKLGTRPLLLVGPRATVKCVASWMVEKTVPTSGFRFVSATAATTQPEAVEQDNPNTPELLHWDENTMAAAIENQEIIRKVHAKNGSVTVLPTSSITDPAQRGDTVVLTLSVHALANLIQRTQVQPVIIALVATSTNENLGANGHLDSSQRSQAEDLYEHLVSQKVVIQPNTEDTAAAVVEALTWEVSQPYSWAMPAVSLPASDRRPSTLYSAPGSQRTSVCSDAIGLMGQSDDGAAGESAHATHMHSNHKIGNSSLRHGTSRLSSHSLDADNLGANSWSAYPLVARTPSPVADTDAHVQQKFPTRSHRDLFTRSLPPPSTAPSQGHTEYEAEGDVIVNHLVKRSNGTFGFYFRTVNDTDPRISRIARDSEHDLCIGDQILHINAVSVRELSHDNLSDFLATQSEVSITVRRDPAYGAFLHRVHPLVCLQQLRPGTASIRSSGGESMVGNGYTRPADVHQEFAVEECVVERGATGHGMWLAVPKGLVNTHVVVKTEPDGNADRAGLRAGDVLDSLDGIPVYIMSHNDVLGYFTVRNKVRVRIRRELPSRPSSSVVP
eukprot:m.31883 g.31883  ORF g.31883 m.31883 type:complete len:836 (+) comp14062_c1_seq1:220-2727(+)